MTHAEPRPRIRAEDLADGRWGEIFTRAGLSEYMEFTRKEGPCPVCGGKDRFRFLDLEGTGRHFCGHCADLKKGVGFGFRLLMKVRGLTFPQAADFVRETFGCQNSDQPIEKLALPPKAAPAFEVSDDDLREKYLALWNDGFELTANDAAGRYINNRAPGLGFFPGVLRFHPNLSYWEPYSFEVAKRLGRKGRVTGKFPGMLGYLQSASGELGVIWRWFLTPDGQKADVPEPKKAAGRWLTPDIALRLAEPTEVLATCEGAESGLGIMALHKIPCWPAINAGALEKFTLPAEHNVRRVFVYGDNDVAKGHSDANPRGVRRGNIAAKVLADKLTSQGTPAFVRMPRTTKIDFADINKSSQK